MDELIRLVPVEDDAAVERLAALAHDIWFGYWPPLIGADQTAYMVEHFQSPAAIRRDIDEHGYRYWFVCAQDDGRVVGYTAGHDDPARNRYYISKIYLLPAERGKHFASAIIRAYNDLARTLGREALNLNVNKYNELGLRAYRANGFTIEAPVEEDLGGGFIADDYVMVRPVA